MTFHNLLIIGCNGGFGVLLSNLLSRAGHNVNGIDLPATANCSAAISCYVSSDATNMSAEAATLVSEADCVIVCIPEPAALACFTKLAQIARSQSLIVDLLSVKSGIVRLMEQTEQPLELLSLHPMFRPSVGFPGQNVIAIEVHPGPLTASFLAFVENSGGTVTLMTAEEHDRATAAIQVASHAALLSYGLALNSIGYRTDRMFPTTPLHRIMLSLLARLLTGEPEVYWHIQLTHPLAADVRETLGQALQRIDRAVQANNIADFECLLNEAKRTIEPQVARLTDYSAAIVKIEM